MAEPQNRILAKLLDRLLASLTNGPALNCRPHASRQRVDLRALSRLGDIDPERILEALLGGAAAARVTARIAPPPDAPEKDRPEDDATAAARAAWSQQQALLSKLRVIADEARTYEQDTGVHALYVGYPLLSLPPGTFAASQGSLGRRVLAPIAFIPVNLAVSRGPRQGVEITCHGEGIDRIVPNAGLLAWLERQTGVPQAEMFDDEHGEQPWREIEELRAHVAKVLEVGEQRAEDRGEQPQECEVVLQPAPRAEDDGGRPRIFDSAVLGLFPMANQGLLRDMQAMADGEPLAGPIENFVRMDASLGAAPAQAHEAARPESRRPKVFAEERLAAPADPCQSRAVRLSRESKGLVIHGPPGTGKSQTITNIIADHLCRGQRVLVVCDKRTALDVVMNRLDHMGLGALAAVVHDPQRDQRDLYRSIREQLDGLPEATSNGSAEQTLVRLDTELHRLLAELTGYRGALMDRDGRGLSFHELVGQWLSLADQSADAPACAPAPGPLGHGPASVPAAADGQAPLCNVTLEELDHRSADLQEILTRTEAIRYPTNLWTSAAGVGLAEFLARPMDGCRAAMARAQEAARAADAAADACVPPFSAALDLDSQSHARSELAHGLEKLLEQADRELLSRWADASPDALRRARQRLSEAAPHAQTLAEGPLDTELAMQARSERPPLFVLTAQRSALEEYLACAAKWYAFACFRRKSAAGAVLRKYGLPLTVANAQRVLKFVNALRSRMLLQSLLRELLPATAAQAAPKGAPLDAVATAVAAPPESAAADMTDGQMEKLLADHTAAVDLLLKVSTTPALESLQEEVSAALREESSAAILLMGLRKSPPRASALKTLEQALDSTGLLAPKWLAAFTAAHRVGSLAAADVTSLLHHLSTLDGVLRVRAGLAALPESLRSAVQQLIDRRESAARIAATVRRAVLAGEITRRLAAQPLLQSLDAHKLRSMFERYRQLDQQKKRAVRDAVVHRWTTVQRERLLAGTGSRLNSMGADLRRRLTLRGERAMRLRQVIAVGQAIDGGDPLLDMRPVWLASPETVAQLFPRRALFDVVIFDEASQCRLEEALPVLTRAGRVVVSGDPKQLPPTRFFESAIATSDDDEPIDSEQALFEAHQGEVEDLLTAALSLEIEQSYLDVHYRSRNGDLIEFSNEHFYASRLQAIPEHPSRREALPPVRLHPAGGVYEDRCNEIEARRVAEIVKELLSREKPPSIGIACFNLQQRDLIMNTLDDMAEDDPNFAAKLAEARQRRGAASFEGLFVKNLENVQGDERDHIIISTTYGPDAKGRFYRRFGPLGQAGGGRRLNVLVTRAREQVHVVTSIPPEAYRALPPIPPGQQPSGGWLLFAYLKFAEALTADYGRAEQEQRDSEVAPAVSVRDWPTQTPSTFAAALAQRLARHHNVGSETHWGNEGFRVDVALHHPKDHEQITIGVLCDAARYDKADDPVEWDIFRTGIHESQGWRLHRVWTPHFFRDPEGSVQAILSDLVDAIAVEGRGAR